MGVRARPDGDDRPGAGICARLAGLVADADVHIVTVTGLAGVGKTRLARAVLDTVPDRVFVPVAATGGSASVGDAIVTSLAGRGGLARSPSRLLWECFDGRRVVVVLDDADHARDLDAAMADLLAGYPAAVLVLTAARPTRARGEHVIALRPLPVPTDADEDTPCISLFVERAGQAGVDFDLADPQVRGEIIRVRQRTGGLPLAIELAAARTATHPLRFIERTLWRLGTPARRRTAAPLTAREREVLAHLASGATNKQIADELCISPKTVMHHSVAIYRKLGVRGRAAATAWAIRAMMADDRGGQDG